jgi:hypothetical protein
MRCIIGRFWTSGIFRRFRGREGLRWSSVFHLQLFTISCQSQSASQSNRSGRDFSRLSGAVPAKRMEFVWRRICCGRGLPAPWRLKTSVRGFLQRKNAARSVRAEENDAEGMHTLPRTPATSGQPRAKGVIGGSRKNLQRKGWYGGTREGQTEGPESTGGNEPSGLVTGTRLGSRMGLSKQVAAGEKDGPGDSYDLRGAGFAEYGSGKSAAGRTG